MPIIRTPPPHERTLKAHGVVRPTVSDVAKKAGVSVATVDRVLNRRAPVKGETARRVLDAAQALGFHASALLQKRLAERQVDRRFGFLLQRKSETFYETLGLELTRATRDATGIAGRATVHYLDDLAPARVAAAIADLGKSCDALAIVAADHPRITEAVESVVARAVPVFTLLSDISAAARHGFIGIDHRKAGRTAAWTVTRLAGAPGRVGIMVGSHRYLGQELCEMSFRSYCREHAPAFELLESRISFENAGFAYEATIDMLRRAPDLVGLYVAGGGMEGVIAALRDRETEGHLVTVCNELIPETRAALIDGIVDLVIATPIRALADRTVAAIASSMAGSGEDVPFQPLPFDIYISENI